ncbi:MAG TPA: DUF1361 domain-containing protein [Candidatus Saccharimonadales bacterium]|nr:DUF1361 domain-containing protein [Candidatus Saccharimonadales bacterium]
MAGVMAKLGKDRSYQFIASVMLACLISLALLAGRIFSSDSLRYIFLVWNLVLAVIPLLVAWWLSERLKTLSWFGWPQVVLSILYLGFLPNTFYLITDFVHLRPTDDVGLYFDVVLLAGFMLNGIVLGFGSVYLIHKQLLRRLNAHTALGIIAVVFFLASFATYLGRFTRFNTWDILLRPAGLLFDVSDRLVNPTQHSDTYLATLTLFLVLFSGYLVVYTYSRLITLKKN